EEPRPVGRRFVGEAQGAEPSFRAGAREGAKTSCPCEVGPREAPSQLLGAGLAEGAARHPLERQVTRADVERGRRAHAAWLGEPAQPRRLGLVLAAACTCSGLDERLSPGRELDVVSLVTVID